MHDNILLVKYLDLYRRYDIIRICYDLNSKQTIANPLYPSEKKMKLAHEYNEYVVGLIITDGETGRSVNFQYKRCTSNHPHPDYQLSYGCEGDSTHLQFTKKELKEATRYVRSLDNAETLETEISAISNNNEASQKALDVLSKTGQLTKFDIKEIYSAI